MLRPRLSRRKGVFLASRQRVLLVDDDASARQGLQKVLAADGYEVGEAENGRQARERFGRSRPDAVIASSRLPDERRPRPARPRPAGRPRHRVPRPRGRGSARRGRARPRGGSGTVPDPARGPAGAPLRSPAGPGESAGPAAPDDRRGHPDTQLPGPVSGDSPRMRALRDQAPGWRPPTSRS